MAGAMHSHGPQVMTLDGQTLLQAFAAGAAWLGENKSIIDSLNVFPVPDGDTGTNMYLTVSSALKEAQKVKAGSVGSVADAIAMGSLMGARGNSGVIFSQLMRGFSKKLHGLATVGPHDFAAALTEASSVAYKAVMKPVEGTILTVARMGARAGVQAARDGNDINAVLAAALRQGEATLEKTPEMLPTLKEAGVVDAGGKGLIIFLEGFARGLRGESAEAILTAETRPGAQVAPEVPAKAHAAVAHAPKQKIEFTYCTELIVRGTELDTEAIKRSLAAAVKGDSTLVVGGPDTVKVHMHTNFPGKILEACVAHGSLHEIHINNMEDQNEEFAAVGGAQPEGAPLAAPVKRPSRDMGIVAVASGDGIEMILKSLGVDVVVTGGQTMNPSIQDIAAAVRTAGAREVVVLPNNGNVVLTARQASEVPDISDVAVHVVPTKTVPQGLAALLAMSPSAPTSENVARMVDAIAKVRSGEITYAVRDSKANGFTIHENDVIGLADGTIKAVGQDLGEVFRELFGAMHSSEDEIVTVLYGAGVTEAEAEALVEAMREQYSDIEFELQYGGQPLYFYLVSVE
ncbi:MAG: DAK2 domain-containing protein [Clostridia bacterium]|nr:DAK2 domain-containing protein [Clostridia bacterium]